MSKQERVAIFIPARMESVRLPGKPLANINGKAMICHVVDRALESDIDNVYVACSEQEVSDAVQSTKAFAIMTDPAHPSGTDRIYEALQKTKEKFDYIVNLQGDLPLLNPNIINIAIDTLKNNKDADIATLACVITDNTERDNPNVVKAVISPRGKKLGKALYFSRATAPYGPGELLHHIGLYVYRRQSLEKFVKLKPSTLEKREKLEQLRAIENDMNIYVAVVDTVPLGVDTPEDLEKIRNIMKEDK